MGCTLRKMQDSDLQFVLEWRNHDDVRKNMYTCDEITFSEHQQWWAREKSNLATHLLIAEIEGVPAGVVIFTKYTGIEGTASWAFYSGDNKIRGVGSLMEVAALKYAFEKLKIRRLECEVLAFNYPVVLFHRKFGFKVEGVKRSAYERQGEFFDIYSLAILEKEWLFSVKLEQQKSNIKIPKVVTKNIVITDAMIKSFSHASMDENNIHFDDAAAQKVGFEGRICHGMLAGSLFSGLFSEPPFGPGSVYLSQTLYFRKPLRVNSEVEVKVKLLSHIGRKITLATTIQNSDAIFIDGEAEILLPKVLL